MLTRTRICVRDRHWGQVATCQVWHRDGTRPPYAGPGRPSVPPLHALTLFPETPEVSADRPIACSVFFLFRIFFPLFAFFCGFAMNGMPLTVPECVTLDMLHVPESRAAEMDL